LNIHKAPENQKFEFKVAYEKIIDLVEVVINIKEFEILSELRQTV